MDNASKALYMAGSLLIALLIISLLVYSFNNIGGVQDERDKIQQEQSISDFNKEYEAYNKRVMYGADLISCVNKASSYNEKNARNGISNLDIDIKVKVKNKFEQSIEFHSFKGGRETKFFAEGDKTKFYTDMVKNNPTIYSLCNVPTTTKIYYGSGKEINEYTKYNEIFKDGENPFIYTDEVINATKELNFEELQKLTATSANLKYKGFNSKFKNDNSTWYSIEWTTALFNFKKAKFRCLSDKIKYDNNTGRITYMEFEEIK